MTSQCKGIDAESCFHLLYIYLFAESCFDILILSWDLFSSLQLPTRAGQQLFRLLQMLQRPEASAMKRSLRPGPSDSSGDTSDTLDLFTGLPLKKVLKVDDGNSMANQDQDQGQDDECLFSFLAMDAERDVIENKQNDLEPPEAPPVAGKADLGLDLPLESECGVPNSGHEGEGLNALNHQVSEDSWKSLDPMALNPDCVEDAPFVAWRDSVLDLLCPRFKAAAWKRPLRLATACSGTGSPKIALRALGVPYQEIVSAERRKSGLQMVLNSPDPPEHHFEYAADVAKNRAHCLLHGKVCSISPLPDDLFVCGFPCSPFSTQRPQRFSGIQGWRSHEDSQCMFDTIDILKARQPRLALLENVMGFLREPRTED